MDKVAVLIPCYNESKTIEKVIKDFKAVLPDATIYVYDNNSTDGTDEIARQNGAVVRYEYQQGKGNVIRRMFRDIDAECYIMTDGDDTYPAVNAPEMVDKVLNRNVDMVVGDRLSSTYFQENKRPFHNFGNSLVRSSINHLFHTDIKDIMTGYRAFSYEFVKTFPVISRGFKIAPENRDRIAVRITKQHTIRVGKRFTKPVAKYSLKTGTENPPPNTANTAEINPKYFIG